MTLKWFLSTKFYGLEYSYYVKQFQLQDFFICFFKIKLPSALDTEFVVFWQDLLADSGHWRSCPPGRSTPSGTFLPTASSCQCGSWNQINITFPSNMFLTIIMLCRTRYIKCLWHFRFITGIVLPDNPHNMEPQVSTSTWASSPPSRLEIKQN